MSTTASTNLMHPDVNWLDLPAPTVQCHAANLMPLPNGAGGDLGCVWFGGTQEGVADISVWFSRSRGGEAPWSEPVRLSDDAERSEQNPILFPAPDGRLWLLHTAQRSGNQDTAVVRCRTSDDGGASWSPTRDLLSRSGVFVRQPLVVLENSHGGAQGAGGDWLLPIFHCRTAPGVRWSGDDDSSAVLISSDQGRNWTEHEVPGSTGCVHMSIVAGADLTKGKLVAFYRSRWADRVYRSESHDGGRHWSVPQPTLIPNNNSSIQVTRLASGRFAIVCNPVGADANTERRESLYDEIEDDAGTAYQAPSGGQAAGRRAFWGTPRAPMSLLLSDDEGLSWPHRIDVEVGDGYCLSNNSAEQRNRELSYPSVAQTADGTIHVAYTHFRQRIRHVRLREDQVIA